jgi:hypothetical protein
MWIFGGTFRPAGDGGNWTVRFLPTYCAYGTEIVFSSDHDWLGVRHSELHLKQQRLSKFVYCVEKVIRNSAILPLFLIESCFSVSLRMTICPDFDWKGSLASFL